MKIQFNELFQNSFVITIDDNLYKNFINCFSKITSILPKRFNGFTIKNGIYSQSGFIKSSNIINCTLSHVTLIKLAQTFDLPFICIFEDDAFPRKDIKTKLQFVLDNIPNDCDMLKLGTFNRNSNKNNKIISINDYIEINNNTCGSHAYIIFKSYYNKYLENMKKQPIADWLVMNDINSHIFNTKEPMFIQNNNLGIHNDEPIEMTINTYSKDYILQNFDVKL